MHHTALTSFNAILQQNHCELLRPLKNGVCRIVFFLAQSQGFGHVVDREIGLVLNLACKNFMQSKFRKNS